MLRMKPVSCITSRISVNRVPGYEFQRLEPSAHLTFLFAGSVWADPSEMEDSVGGDTGAGFCDRRGADIGAN